MRKVLWSQPHLPSLANQEGLVSIRYNFSYSREEARNE